MAQQQKIKVYAEDMTDEMMNRSIEIAKEAFLLSGKNSLGMSQNSYIAKHIRTEHDKAHGNGWCIIVGRNFGSFVTHQMKTYVYFSCDGVHVLAFKP